MTRSPENYPRRVLLAATGMSPQILTETCYSIAVAATPTFIPTKIHLLTTERGKRSFENECLIYTVEHMGAV